MNKIHLIGNAHLDPVWLWQWQEGFAEVKATFKSALDRMKEYDDFVFTSACGAYYMWIEKSDPKMFEEIQMRVKEGRWCITGGWLIQPDCNIPTGESFARHALITQNYFIEKFGKPAQTGYNVDSFGHNGSIPKILRASRMKNYVFMRPMANEKTLSSNLFIWESADGSKVKTYRIPICYNINEGENNKLLDVFSSISELSNTQDQMAFYGVGNHGGGPTVSLLKKMHEILSKEYVYSDPDRYFDAQLSADLPVLYDDLQFHAKGCYSAYSEIKRNNRYAENALLEAERFSVLSKKLINTPYPEKELTHAWKIVLFNQFHDILGGCSIREAYDDAREQHGEALSIAHRIQNFACQQISWNINTLENHLDGYVSTEDAEKLGVPIVIFNCLSHSVKAPIRIRNKFNGVRNEKGQPLPIQVVRDSKTNGENDRYARLFEAEVPALGYTVYRMYNEPIKAVETTPFIITENSIENTKLRVTFDNEIGEITSIFDIENNKELLSSPTSITLYNDEKNDTWAHNTVFFKDKVLTSITGSARVIENGPVRATIRTKQEFGNSALIRDYSITKNSNFVDVKVKLDFHEKHRILKFNFPIASTDANAICKIPFGTIKRPTDGSEQVSGDWIALSNENGGITIATDCKHSFDAEGNVLSLTVLRSAIFADHYGVRDEFCEYTEQKEHVFKYRISPFTSCYDAEQKAIELQFSPFAIQETFHKGELPTVYEGMKVSANNVFITAVKQHRLGNGTVIRAYENEGKDTNVNITLFDNTFNAFIPHDAIKTFYIKDGEMKEIDFLE